MVVAIEVRVVVIQAGSGCYVNLDGCYRGQGWLLCSLVMVAISIRVGAVDAKDGCYTVIGYYIKLGWLL